MEVKLNQDDSLRINSEYGKCSNFIDLKRAGFSGLSATLFTGFQYIEIRKKGDQIKIFTFPKKSHKKEYDFGEIWKDAEVIYSINEQVVHKD